MPAEQRGSIYRTNTGYGIRYTDEHGARKRRSGFRSRSAARHWLEQVEKPRQRGEPATAPQLTFDEFADRYLQAHSSTVEASTLRTLEHRLGYARSAFGSVPLTDLERMPDEIAAWRRRLPPGTAYGITAALRQTLKAAVDWRYISTNPAKDAGPNPQPKRTEIEPFTVAEIDRLAVELGPWGPFPILAAETGLRPAELAGLEWRDLQPADGVLLVERTHTNGELKPYGKTARSRRRVPLTTRALDALDTLPRRIDTPAVFASPRSKRLDTHNFRAREWLPALDAAGIRRRRIYDLRHTFATHALAAGSGCSSSAATWEQASSSSTKPTAISPKAPKTEPAHCLKGTSRIVLAKS